MVFLSVSLLFICYSLLCYNLMDCSASNMGAGVERTCLLFPELVNQLSTKYRLLLEEVSVMHYYLVCVLEVYFVRPSSHRFIWDSHSVSEEHF